MGFICLHFVRNMVSQNKVICMEMYNYAVHYELD